MNQRSNKSSPYFLGLHRECYRTFAKPYQDTKNSNIVTSILDW